MSKAKSKAKRYDSFDRSGDPCKMTVPSDNQVAMPNGTNGYCLEHATVECHGSIYLVRPATDAARKWLREHTDGRWFGDALAVAPRYVIDLVDGLSADLNA